MLKEEAREIARGLLDSYLKVWIYKTDFGWDYAAGNEYPETEPIGFEKVK